MEKTKILIVEDEMIIAENLSESLEEMGYEVIDISINYREAILAIEKEEPDLAILDIQLSGKRSGIELAAEINATYQFPFIFLTSNSDDITLGEAKLVSPYAFLVKPFNHDELHAAIEVGMFNFSREHAKAINRQNLIIKEAIFIKQNKVYHRIDLSDISHLRSDHVYLDIVLVDGKRLKVRGTIEEYLAKLGADFIRCHRSYLINLKHLRGINSSHAIMLNEEIPMGKKYRDGILQLLNKG